MKICFLTHTLDTQTGTGEFASSLISEMKALLPGSEFTILTGEGVLSSKYLSIVKNLPYIRKKMREADLIHALDNYPYGVIAALSNLFLNRPLVITAIGTGSLQLFGRKGWKAVLFRWAYSQASKITSISRFVAAQIELHLPSTKPMVINPGIDYRYWSAIGTSGIDSKLKKFQPYILSVGEFKKRKGYEHMLPVIRKVLEVHPEAQYVIVANAEKNIDCKSRLKKIAKELGIEDKVTILSNLKREELRSVYRHASAYLTLPQNVEGDIEGFGMSILQAAAAGVPAVVGEGSGADDALKDKVSGYLVLSKEEAVEKLHLLLNDRALRKEMSEGARQFASNMSWREQGKDYALIYKEFKQ